MASRNVGKHTDAAVAKANILKALSKWSLNKSGMGYAAFPDYTFSWPQGAAFAVAKLCREMIDDGLISVDFQSSHQYRITQKGRDALSVFALAKLAGE